METLKISQIVVDENQPRKFFAEDKMTSLKKSIKRLGIKTPLVVEDMGNGKYLLENGERRLRAAKDIGMTEVPVLIEKTKNKLERVIQQFHLQQQHEDWQPTEKAMVINMLADKEDGMGLDMKTICEQLEIPEKNARRYFAFSQLINRETFQKHNLNLDWATIIRQVIVRAKSVSQNNDIEFNRSDEKKLELALIKRVSEGEIRNTKDLARIKDSFSKEPKSIRQFIETNITPNELFVNSNARESYIIRNMLSGVRLTATYISQYAKLDKKVMKIDPQANRNIKSLIRDLTTLSSQLED